MIKTEMKSYMEMSETLLPETTALSVVKNFQTYGSEMPLVFVRVVAALCVCGMHMSRRVASSDSVRSTNLTMAIA